MPESLHVYYVLRGKERTLLQSSRILSCFGWEVDIDENVVENGDFVVIGHGAFDNGFMEGSEVAVGLGRIVFHSFTSRLANSAIEKQLAPYVS